MSDAGVGAAPATALRAADAARRRRAFGRLATRNRLAVLAALVLVAAVLAALLAPWLPLADPDVVDTPNRLRPPLAAGAMLVGVTLGVLGGFYTGWVEAVVMRLTDILMAFPYVLLAIAIVAGLS